MAQILSVCGFGGADGGMGEAGSACDPGPPSLGSGTDGGTGIGGSLGVAGTSGAAGAAGSGMAVTAGMGGVGGQSAKVLSFLAPISYASGGEPNSVALGDVNDDGKADIVVGNRNNGTNDGGISVLLNSGNGTFAAPVTYAPTTGVSSIALGDVDGDGKADLAVAKSDAFTQPGVSVLLNNGNGTFAAPITYATDAGASSVALGDLNGDGRTDLAVTYSNNVFLAGVSVFLNNGNGTFSRGVTYGAGQSPISVAVGDLNGDGKADLAVASYSSEVVGIQENLSVLLNRGDGTFRAAVVYAAGEWLSSVKLGDLNGDGRADLAVTTEYTVDVLLNSGNGTFDLPVTYAVGPSIVSLALGDVDGDGHLDLATVNPAFVGPAGPGGGNVGVLLNNGNGTFASPVYFPDPDAQRSIAIGELNGDGKADLAVVNLTSGCAEFVSVLLNDSP